MYPLVRPLLFALPPERAHALAMRALECRLRLAGLPPPPAAAARTVMGLPLANPVGLAAGFDKNAAHVDALATLGFGFIEVGGVTLHPQHGNPPPRLFRLPPAQALINRMGFNSHGAAAVAANLEKRRYHGIVGVNIGKNAGVDGDDAIGNYAGCLETLYPHGDFFTINVSSPNTENLRDWQQHDALRRLLAALIQKRDALAQTHGRRAPLAVKIAPDIGNDDMRGIAALARELGIDGIVAVNTTTARPPDLAALPHGGERGGLSGAPLAARATEAIKTLRAELPPHIALIGVGGIASAADAREKLAAGADLIQLYTGLIYRGAGLPRDIIHALRG